MKELIVGAGVAAALGLYLGNLAQPQLAVDTPQPMQPATALFTGWDDSVPSPYGGRVPDHVIGSDWTPQTHAVAAETHTAPLPTPDDIEWAYEERAFAETADSAPPPEAPSAAPTYPSVDGDILAGTSASEPLASLSPDV